MVFIQACGEALRCALDRPLGHQKCKITIIPISVKIMIFTCACKNIP
jgi:hypothetical protein